MGFPTFYFFETFRYLNQKKLTNKIMRKQFIKVAFIAFLLMSTSCNKVLDIIDPSRIAPSSYLLDSVSYTYPASSTTSVRTIAFYYDKSNKVEKEIYRTIQTVAPYLSLDTSFYSLNGTDVYRQYGLKGTSYKLGTINAEGYLLPTTDNYTISKRTTTLLGNIYTDTSAYGYLTNNLNFMGQPTSRSSKNYYTYTNATGVSYPLIRNLILSQYNSSYVYDIKGVSEYTEEVYRNNKTETKSSATAAWAFGQYLTINANGVNVSSPAYTKNTYTYSYTDTKDFVPTYSFNVAESYIQKDVSILFRNSLNGTTWTTVKQGLQYYTTNVVVDHQRIISFDYLNTDGTLSFSKKYYYHKK